MRSRHQLFYFPLGPWGPEANVQKREKFAHLLGFSFFFAAGRPARTAIGLATHGSVDDPSELELALDVSAFTRLASPDRCWRSSECRISE